MILSDSYLFQSSAINPQTSDTASIDGYRLAQSFKATQKNTTSVNSVTDHSKRLDAVVQKTEDVLLKVNAVFPFDFFPDEIIIDKNKVSVIHHVFFGAQEIRSIPIEDIADVIADLGPLFGQVKFVNKQFIFEPLAVQYLKRKDASKVQQVVQGLVLANQGEVDFTKVTDTNLISKAEASGKV